jgi:hypothetical protein
MKLIPIYDNTASIACTIGGDEVHERLELLERMRHHLDRIERTEHGMLLHFPKEGDIDADLHQFVVDEKRCCQFWGFAINSTDSELILRWDAPPDAGDLVTELLAYFEGPAIDR